MKHLGRGPGPDVYLLLPHHYISNSDLRILMVPLGRNAFEGETKRLALAGGQRRRAEVDGFGIRSAGFQYFQRSFFALGELSHVIFEFDFDYDVRHGLVAGVSDGAVDVTDGRSDKVLGRGPYAPLGPPRKSSATIPMTAITATTAMMIVQRLESRSSETGTG